MTRPRAIPLPFLADQTPRDASWWRFLVSIPAGLLVGSVCLLALGIAMAIVFVALMLGHVLDPTAPMQLRQIIESQQIAPNDLAANLGVLSVLAALNMSLFGGFVILGAVIYRRRLMTYWTSAKRFRWRLTLLGLALFLILLGPPLYFTRDLGSSDPSGPMPLLAISPQIGGRVLFAVVTSLALLVAAAAEEVLFRGWLLRHLSALLRNPWVAVVVGSLIFSAAHGDFNPDAFLERAVMGMGLCYSALRLGGVELPLGIHAGNNILIVLLIEPLKLTPEPRHPWNWEVLPALLVIIVSYVAFTELVARWKPLARWAGVEAIQTAEGSFD